MTLQWLHLLLALNAETALRPDIRWLSLLARDSATFSPFSTNGELSQSLKLNIRSTHPDCIRVAANSLHLVPFKR